jgi:peptidoglycan/xylan/chitin deacetylase (PgdA/CDA1 family)
VRERDGVTATRRAALVRVVASGLHATGGVRLLALAARHVAIGPDRRPRLGGPTFPVLAFHRVNDERDPFFPAVPTAAFDRWMRHLARTYRVLALEELAERARGDGVPRGAIAVTFDDGYRDTLTHAAPVLARYGVPATVFLTTGCIGAADVLWFDRLALAFRTTTRPRYEAPWGEVLPLGSVGERLRALDQLLAHLKRQPDDVLRETVAAAASALGVTDRRGLKDLMLSWDDVHALAGLGFAIGAHTVNHPILSRVSLDRARREIEGSRAMIEAACGRPPRSFAYPNGGAADYTPEIARLVEQAGFSCAVTTRFGVNSPETSRWELRRGGPWEHHLPTFALKLAWYQAIAPRG